MGIIDLNVSVGQGLAMRLPPPLDDLLWNRL